MTSTTPRKRRPKTDWPKLNAELYARDGGCVAPLIDPDCGPCRDVFGHERDRTLRAILTREHVQDGGTGSMGLRAKDDLNHLVLACYGHHTASAWCLAHKQDERDYIARRKAEAEIFTESYAGSLPMREDSPSYRSDMQDAGRGGMLR
jgi:hypothetical protein